MATKVYIIKHRQNAEIERLVEAKTRGTAEGAILADYSVEAVSGHNAAEMAELVSKGIKVEKVGL